MGGADGGRIVAGIAVAMMVLAGCGSVDAGTARTQSERASGDVDVAADHRITVETEQGSITTDGTGQLPADFPVTVPLVDGEIESASRLEETRTRAWTLVIRSEARASDVYAQGRSMLESDGYRLEVDTSQSVSGIDGGALQATDGIWQVLFAVTGEGGTRASYTVLPAGS